MAQISIATNQKQPHTQRQLGNSEPEMFVYDQFMYRARRSASQVIDLVTYVRDLLHFLVADSSFPNMHHAVTISELCQSRDRKTVSGGIWKYPAGNIVFRTQRMIRRGQLCLLTAEKRLEIEPGLKRAR